MGGAGIHQTVVGDHNIFTGSGDIRITFQLPPAEAEERRLHLQLTESVRRFWIEGVLEHSVHEAAMVALRKEARPEAVDHPWERVLELPRGAAETLGPDRAIGDVFAGTGRTLLILGEPGSGKTVTLLELARELIGRFEREPTEAAPVVLNLTTWERGPLAAWIEAEMKSKYFIPPRRSRKWLEQSRLIPLLDGLDELPGDRRPACVAAINQFLESGGVSGIAVCCRLAEYLALPERLRFGSAVCLQPLQAAQIEEYLARGGSSLWALREVICGDPLLQELARSPLMLNVICLAYGDQPVEKIAQSRGDTAEARRANLFACYVERMFARIPRAGFSESQTTAWLSWLAGRMRDHSLTVFLVESLQPSWLATAGQRRAYALGSRVLICLAWGMCWWLATLALFAEARRVALPGFLTTLLFASLHGVIAGFLADWRMRVPPVGARSEKWRVACEVLLHPLLAAVLLACLAVLTEPFFAATWRLILGLGPDVPMPAWEVGLRVGMVNGLWFGLILGLKRRGRSVSDDIRLSGALRASAAGARTGAKWGALIGGSFFLLLLAVALTIHWAGDSAWWRELTASLSPQTPLLSAGLLLAVCLIVSGIAAGVTAIIGALFGMLAPTGRLPSGRPGYGLWLSGANAVVAGLAVGTVVGLLATFGNAATGTPGDSRYTVMAGSAWGLAAAVWYGGQDFIQHLTLRLQLRRCGWLPKNFVRFLDHAARLIFLQKVGSGYIFMHRQLLEYFAGLEVRRGK